MPLKGRVILCSGPKPKERRRKGSPAVDTTGQVPAQPKLSTDADIRFNPLVPSLGQTPLGLIQPSTRLCARSSWEGEERTGDPPRPGKRANKHQGRALGGPPPQIKKSESRDSRLPRARKFYEGNPACKKSHGRCALFCAYYPHRITQRIDCTVQRKDQHALFLGAPSVIIGDGPCFSPFLITTRLLIQGPSEADLRIPIRLQSTHVDVTN
ncbi:hypothetical protein GGI35DRAFT_461299 [Trichoderma velutinum]